MTWESTPFINVAPDQEFLTALSDWYHNPENFKDKAVARMKKWFGKQDYCYTTYRRYWVWEGKNWRAFANNEYGIGLEVRVGLSVNEIREAFQDFREKRKQ